MKNSTQDKKHRKKNIKVDETVDKSTKLRYNKVVKSNIERGLHLWQ